MFVGASVSVGALFSVFENVQTSMLTCCVSLAINWRFGRSHACPQATQINAASMHVTVQRYRHAASPVVRDHFTSLEQSWLRLAAEIESGEWLLYLFGEISRDLVPIAEAAE